jgi:hypothetical protein
MRVSPKPTMVVRTPRDHPNADRLATGRRVDGIDPERGEGRVHRAREHRHQVLLEHDATILERAARLALTQEGAIRVALVRLLHLGVRDQVVEEVGAADGVDVLVGLSTQLVLGLAP